MDALRKLYVFGDAEQRAGAEMAVDDIWKWLSTTFGRPPTDGVGSDDPRRRRFDGLARHHCRGAARTGTAEIPCRDFVDTTRRSVLPQIFWALRQHALAIIATQFPRGPVFFE
jgi:hypothetical protein